MYACSPASEARVQVLDKEIAALNNPVLEPLLSLEEHATIQDIETAIGTTAIRETSAEHGLKDGEKYEDLPLAQGLAWFTCVDAKLEARCAELRADVLSYTLQHVMGATNPTRFNEYLRARARLYSQYQNVRRLFDLKRAYLQKKDEEATESRRELSYGERVMHWQAMMMLARRKFATADALRVSKRGGCEAEPSP